MRVLGLAVGLALALVFPAAAQERDLIDLVTEISTTECDGAESTLLTFDQAITLPREQVPDCFAVDGLWDGQQIYADLAGYYHLPRDHQSPHPSRIGVYGPLETIDVDRLVPARLVGRLGDCEDFRPSVWMSGYCHYFPGRILILGRAQITGPTPARWTGAEARHLIGSMVEPSADWPDRSYVEGLAAEWLALLRAGDPVAYRARYPLPWEPALAEEMVDPESEVNALFSTPSSVFAQLQAATDPLPRIWRTPLTDESEGQMAALACYALGDWSDDRWPVALGDADNAPTRPYVCLRLMREALGDGSVREILEVGSWWLNLAEPTW